MFSVFKHSVSFELLLYDKDADDSFIFLSVYLDRYSDCDGKPREIYRSTVSIYGTSAEQQVGTLYSLHDVSFSYDKKIYVSNNGHL